MNLSRRSLLQIAAAGALSFPLRTLATPSEGEDKIILSAPLTHPDWMLKPGIAWGPEGVHHMLDACKACGWSRVHWRVFDGGRAVYASKLARPAVKVDADYVWDPQTDKGKAIFKK